ncbi:DeoR/GlpR family DNA-binding transcription regulator [Amycolatopsis sp. FDAARGOS 1241]|uniref:DeoR/GlpR family DNA-binding transcription regulator n=1 Tax=Amycolatopsis sp. FDAARGOS 1241 TaxID=2778070 RepID=UPI00194DF8FB|nr:DeoR/GlpR family DNA-binding transcription regulator [Amycolatopsis sp. FDAARGOS 1241]QRP45338.1 DeoR/GlpR transcriptional regulator [Amycolatopsis sp. FDAARGOS 1241]
MPKTRPSDAAVEQRRQDILDHVIERGEVRIDDLTARFGVSLMTMHRDLDDLAERRLLRKLRGKVEAYPALTMETASRFTLHSAEKVALAEAAVKHVEPGQTVFVDDSTTLFPLVERLAEIPGLTVITNSLRAARLLGTGVDVVVAGGRYDAEYDSCSGPDVLALLDRTRADVAFVSVSAVAVGRLFHPVRDYAELKKAVLRAANRNVLVLDHSKFGRTATYAHGDVGDYDLLITSEATPTEEIEAALNAGTAVETVEHVEEGQPYDS